jgi:hypothetical protein
MKHAKDENTLPEYLASVHSGNAQGFNQPSPTGNFPARPLPQAGEGLHGERMSSLPSLKEDFDYNKQSMARSERSGQVVSHDDETEKVIGGIENAAGKFMAGDPIGAAVSAIGTMTELNKPTEDGTFVPVSGLDIWKQKFGGR